MHHNVWHSNELNGPRGQYHYIVNGWCWCFYKMDKLSSYKKTYACLNKMRKPILPGILTSAHGDKHWQWMTGSELCYCLCWALVMYLPMPYIIMSSIMSLSVCYRSKIHFEMLICTTMFQLEQISHFYLNCSCIQSVQVTVPQIKWCWCNRYFISFVRNKKKPFFLL